MFLPSWTTARPSAWSSFQGSDLAFCILARALDASQICDAERGSELWGPHRKQVWPLMSLACPPFYMICYVMSDPYQTSIRKRQMMVLFLCSHSWRWNFIKLNIAQLACFSFFVSSFILFLFWQTEKSCLSHRSKCVGTVPAGSNFTLHKAQHCLTKCQNNMMGMCKSAAATAAAISSMCSNNVAGGAHVMPAWWPISNHPQEIFVGWEVWWWAQRIWWVQSQSFTPFFCWIVWNSTQVLTFVFLSFLWCFWICPHIWKMQLGFGFFQHCDLFVWEWKKQLW